METPLFVATENARAELLRFPEGGLTNTTQLLPILARTGLLFRLIAPIVQCLSTSRGLFTAP